MENEELFSDGAMELLREEGVERMMGALGDYGFESLVSPPNVVNPVHHNYELQQPVQQQQQYQQYSSSQVTFSGLSSSYQQQVQGISFQQQDQLGQYQYYQQSHHSVPQVRQQQPGQNCWDSVDEEAEDSLQIPISDSNLCLPPVQEQIPPVNSVPSIQPWSGPYGFSLSLMTDNKDQTKWKFSKVLNKLYTIRNYSVPVDLKLCTWVNAKVRITPIYKQSEHRMDPVSRCYNCKSSEASHVAFDHIVQVESERCSYEIINERHVVTVPLMPPPPGEGSTTILMKLACWTSCVGGPNRRPFALVFSLHCNSTGNELGRQVLDLKSCQCPKRDHNNEHKQLKKTENGESNTDSVTSRDEKQNEALTRVANLASEIKVGEKRKRVTKPQALPIKLLKVEPKTEFVSIMIPAEFEHKIKKYVNALIANKHAKKYLPDIIPYPQVESETSDADAG